MGKAHRLVLRRGKDKPLRYGHPWVFRGSIEPGCSLDFEPGATAEIYDSAGEFLARGYANPRSDIVFRALTFDSEEEVDPGLVIRRLECSVALRKAWDFGHTNGVRMVFAEADRLPGLVVDRFGDVAVMQVSTAGMERYKRIIADWLMSNIGVATVYERSDVEARVAHEGLPRTTGLLAGREPEQMVVFHEHGALFSVDVREGHKTGYYLDQRRNRQAVARLAAGLDVLEVFSFTGAFGLFARKTGARSVWHVDSSRAALEGVVVNLRNNGIAPDSDVYVLGDATDVMRKLYEDGRRFGMVILDPPKFASSRTHLDRALRGYREVNMLGARLVESGGWLATFSCSGAVSVDVFESTVSSAVFHAGRTIQFVDRYMQDADHPIAAHFPESSYLKGVLARVL